MPRRKAGVLRHRFLAEGETLPEAKMGLDKRDTTLGVNLRFRAEKRDSPLCKAEPRMTVQDFVDGRLRNF